MNESDCDPIRDFPEVLKMIEDAPPQGQVQLPEGLLFSLERARREAMEAQRGSRGFRPLTLGLGLALAAALALGLVGLQFIQPKPLAGAMAKVTITSPGDLISTTRPTIAWTSKDRPSQRYDVWVLPEEGDHLTVAPLLVAKDVTSPVAFEKLRPEGSGTPEGESELEAGRAYRVLVCLADGGRMSGMPIPFRVN
jgi:hypothetical protein